MRKGEVCGACSGALLVLGLKYGQCKKDDLDSRTIANQKTVEFLHFSEIKKDLFLFINKICKTSRCGRLLTISHSIHCVIITGK